MRCILTDSIFCDKIQVIKQIDNRLKEIYDMIAEKDKLFVASMPGFSSGLTVLSAAEATQIKDHIMDYDPLLRTVGVFASNQNVDEIRYAVVSISTPYERIVDPERSFTCSEYAFGVGYISLYFDDLDVQTQIGLPNGKKRNAVILSDKMAQDIWSYMKSVAYNTDLFVIHCDAGRSRSPGIAAGIVKGLGDYDGYFFDRFTPNRFAYRKMLETVYTNTE